MKIQHTIGYTTCIVAVLIGLSACGSKIKKIDRAAFNTMIEAEYARYTQYLDQSIKKVQDAEHKDSSKVYLGALFKNYVKYDSSYHNVASFKRWDIYVKGKGKEGKMKLHDCNVSYASQKFEPVQCEVIPGLIAYLHPIAWQRLEIDYWADKKITNNAVQHWAYASMSPEDTINSSEKLNRIHMVSFLSPTDTARITLDMGTANPTVFYALLDSMKACGATHVRITSYGEDE